jgi:hypothetical protein
MKRFLSLLLMVILFIQVGGFFVFFSVRLVQLQQQNRSNLANLPISKLAYFSFSEEEFQQVRVNKHEIKINGNMYDIARQHQRNNRIHIYAQKDEAEDNLFIFLREVATRIQRDEKQVPGAVSILTTLVYLPGSIVNIHLNEPINIFHNSFYSMFWTSLVRSIHAPPPRM